MAIPVSSNIMPKGGGTFYILEDTYLKGGFRVCDTIDDRDAIDSSSLKKGMMVLTADTMQVWILQEDLAEWQEFKGGGGGVSLGKRSRVTRTTPSLEVNGFEDFSLNLGNCCLLLSVEVDVPCLVEIFETSKRIDENPYRFLATADHLMDDGRTSSGDAVIHNRRYSVICNLDSEESMSGKIFFRISNAGDSPVPITLSLVYLTLES